MMPWPDTPRRTRFRHSKKDDARKEEEDRGERKDLARLVLVRDGTQMFDRRHLEAVVS